jgi:hypothetical protein
MLNDLCMGMSQGVGVCLRVGEVDGVWGGEEGGVCRCMKIRASPFACPIFCWAPQGVVYSLVVLIPASLSGLMTHVAHMSCLNCS